ncbi:FAD-dependent oxidoreductase [Microbaculum marinum]|uniref:FAD-dependent oxidoreductase n=1 Tax=Microbaculum marinum TaxID=1764581 RepID=A0AAW9RRD1_9HYPH
MSETRQRHAIYSFGYRRSADQDAAVPVRHPAVIVGAGPVGLATAIDLGQRGIPVVLLDDADRIGEGSRGLCYSKRCLEILDTVGVGEEVAAKGVSWKVGKVYFHDHEVYEFDLLPEPGHKMPAFVNLQQYYLEKYLVERVDRLDNVTVRWRNRVTGLAQDGHGVTVEVDTPEGPYRLVADWLIAADGANSTVRRLMGIAFVGETFKDQFLIADIRMEADFPAVRRFWFEPPFHNGQSTLLHKQPDNVWRVDFQIGWDADPEEETKEANVRARIDRMMEGRPYELEWVSVYTFQCRRNERFVYDRVIFAGDAAHQVSPFGARGANSGIEDAHNLAWKLALVLKGEAPQTLIGSYDLERIQAADVNIRHSTRSTDFLVPKSPGDKHLRDAVLQLARKYPFARRMVNSGRLHTAAHYDSALSTPDEEKFGGSARLGDPAPDAPLVDAAGNEVWLLNALSRDFTLLHLANGAAPNVPEGISLLTIGTDLKDASGVFTQRYDATPGACYLLRPDQYLAARFRSFDRTRVESALARARGE